MTIHNTRDLIGRQLDWAVRSALYPGCSDEYVESRDNYSTCWNKAGPILDRSRVSIWTKHDGWWHAAIYNLIDVPQYMCTAHTPLVAAMRCFVAAKLGDTVDLPEGL